MMNARAWRATALAMLPPLVGFVCLMGAAMAYYPGGTWEEPGAHGHSLFWNYFCDLLRPVALNKAPNPIGSVLAEAALVALVVALIPFFAAAPLCFPERPRLGRLVRVSGMVCAAAGLAVVLVPSHKFGSLLHGIVLLLAAVPGLTATIAAAIGGWSVRPPAWPLRIGSAGTLVCLAAAVAVFARQLSIGSESTPGLAALQKLAVAFTMVWMAATTLRVLRALG